MEDSKSNIFKINLRFVLVLGTVLLVILQFTDFFIYNNFSIFLNPNFVFGLVQGNIFAIITSIIVLILILFFLNNYLCFGHPLVIGGLISNIADRLFYGGTVDYFKLWIIPTFNLADVLIIIGIIFIVLKIIKTT